MKITAKVHCASRVKEAHNGDGESTVRFTAHYMDADGNRINEAWAKYTPVFNCSMVVVDSVPFEAGKAYTLIFDDGEPAAEHGASCRCRPGMHAGE